MCMNGGMQLMAKKLIGAGCSFIQGAELGDENSKLGYSVDTYPALIAKKLNLSYDCLAYGGASNIGIAKMILDHDIQDAILMVQWTFESRVGLQLNLKVNPMLKNGINWFDLAPGNWLFRKDIWSPPKYMRNLATSGFEKFQEDFYKYVGNDETFVLYSDLAMKSVLHHAQQQNAKVFFFTASDRLIGINRCMAFEGKSFIAFAKKHSCPIGKLSHPLHQAHQLAADYILENVNIIDD